MSTNKDLPDPEAVLRELMDEGAIDFGVITDGLTDTPEHQDAFDRDQKDKAPITGDA